MGSSPWFCLVSIHSMAKGSRQAWVACWKVTPWVRRLRAVLVLAHSKVVVGCGLAVVFQGRDGGGWVAGVLRDESFLVLFV